MLYRCRMTKTLAAAPDRRRAELFSALVAAHMSMEARAQGRTQGQLAEATGVSAPTWSYWAHGHRGAMGLDEFFRGCEYLGVPPALVASRAYADARRQLGEPARRPRPVPRQPAP